MVELTNLIQHGNNIYVLIISMHFGESFIIFT